MATIQTPVRKIKVFETLEQVKEKMDLNKEQIQKVIDWMNTWEQLKDTAIPLRFKEEFTKQLTLTDVAGDFFCNDEEHYPNIEKCKQECDMCKKERLKQ